MKVKILRQLRLLREQFLDAFTTNAGIGVDSIGRGAAMKLGPETSRRRIRQLIVLTASGLELFVQTGPRVGLDFLRLLRRYALEPEQSPQVTISHRALLSDRLVKKRLRVGWVISLVVPPQSIGVHVDD